MRVSEREVPPADRTRDPETEGVGRGAQPGAEGVAGEAQAQEEGTPLSLHGRECCNVFAFSRKFRLFC